MSLLSNARPYRKSSPDPTNSPNPTTRTCTCTQGTASTYSSAWFLPSSPLSYSLYPRQSCSKSRARRRSRLAWSCFLHSCSAWRWGYWQKQKDMRCLLLPLRKFYFSFRSFFSCITIQISSSSLPYRVLIVVFSSSLGARCPYAANSFADKDLSAYDIIISFLFKGDCGFKSFRALRAGAWRCIIIFALGCDQ